MVILKQKTVSTLEDPEVYSRCRLRAAAGMNVLPFYWLVQRLDSHTVKMDSEYKRSCKMRLYIRHQLSILQLFI